MIRSYLVKALYDGLLGPRDGVREEIQEPFLKYELGILNSSANIAEDEENRHAPDADIRTEHHDEDVDNSREKIDPIDGEGSLTRQEVDAEINFKTGAISLGVQFVINGNPPKFKVCMTWARYEPIDSKSTARMFKRVPSYVCTDWLTVKEPGCDIPKPEIEPGVFMHVLVQKIKDSNSWAVRVFLENKTKYKKPQKEKDRIFQPQIRIKKSDDSEMLQLSAHHKNSYHSDDDLLYRKGAKARGYMCSAVWKDVDPEIEPDGEIGSLTWRDRDSVPKDVREEFTRPDVRTEYIPMYTILQPEKKIKEFKASELSSMWDPSTIKDVFGSMIKEYGSWIEDQRKKLSQLELNSEFQKRYNDNMTKCDDTIQRIKNGVEFLRSSERARAAFCFMNEAMRRKRLHEEGQELAWREFQMAFILQSLRGVAGESKEERDLADVLWFPTGGGKTEAYLGLVVFALAYRRLTPDGKSSNDGGVAVISRYTLRLLTIQQFERALGAIVAADMLRVSNWTPVQTNEWSTSDQYMADRHEEGVLWGRSRFSIGLWIGSETTPKDFAYRTIKKGRKLLNCEGMLLPTWSNVRKFIEQEKGDPALIHKCPVCQNILCISGNQSPGKPTKLIWIIKSSKDMNDLNLITKDKFTNYTIRSVDRPVFESMDGSIDGKHLYRMSLQIQPRSKNGKLTRSDIDTWWHDTVQQQIDPDDESFMSTSPSLPGYFFIYPPGHGSPHDFAIFCTNGNCSLNKNGWYEKPDGVHMSLVPELFKASDGQSKCMPISAYTIDEQIYSRCPSFVIATVDKFANLPFVPRCGSLFGNVDVFHPIFGYGRHLIFTSLWEKDKKRRTSISDDDLFTVNGFNPPSLILQDELHLIEGALGSMVGAYEMAVDVLASEVARPKYIASSATIKETESQVGTVFRRGISVFPPSGIDTSDTYFSKINEDPACSIEEPGRLYLGIATTKTTVTLPIKAQSIIMSEIFKIKNDPDSYKLTPNEASNINRSIDPYWTFVSYFTDLQLLAKFENFYTENIMEKTSEFGMEKSNFNGKTTDTQFNPGMRVFPVISTVDMKIDKIHVHTNDVGKIKIAIYEDGDPIGKQLAKSKYIECKGGTPTFYIENESIQIPCNKKIWIGIINDNPDTIFESFDKNGAHEAICNNDGIEMDFNKGVEIGKPCPVNVKITLSSYRKLEPEGNIVLSSKTKSEDLPGELERLKDHQLVDSLQTSPVFGTGIDVDRLGIMEVMNQPKTNSGYIQSTGRVGRTSPGLIISWLRAGRARDLNHYENFVGYHRALNKFVEPVTASPFSSEAMKLCLGPVLVSILRNSRSVLGATINPAWMTDRNGPQRMKDHSDDLEVKEVRKFLEQIASSNFIAKYRKMPKYNFSQILGEAISSWKGLPNRADDDSELKYSERNPNQLPTHDVVLGNPSHVQIGKKVAYRDVPNSLRNTEPTAIFYGGNDIVPIRPSQFVTRYGPGSLISGRSVTWVVPSIQEIVENLNGRIFEIQSDDITAISKYEVNNGRMKRMLQKLTPTMSIENIRLFHLPTNTLLRKGDFDKLYKCKLLSNWMICYHPSHQHTKILVQLNPEDNFKIKCPKCQESRNDPYSDKFYNVRYYAACRNGHLGDIDWKMEVHRNHPACKGDVFEWSVEGGTDNVTIRCLGHWEGGEFKSSKCKARTTHIEMKVRSKNGEIYCTSNLIEGGHTKLCDKINDVSQAKMISRSQMSLRMSITYTSMEIGTYQSLLFRACEPLASRIDQWMEDRKNPSQDDFIKFLKTCEGKQGFNPDQIRMAENLPSAELAPFLEKIKKSTMAREHITQLSESESLAMELESLEEQTLDCGTGVQVGPDDPPTDRRFPIKFDAFGMSFEAMPFSKIEVTQVQTGYTREITPSEKIPDTNPKAEHGDLARIGKPVRLTSRYKSGKNVWYLANQLLGEGIFIHLDPEKYDDAREIFRNNNSEAFKKWSQIWNVTKSKNETLIRSESTGEEEDRQIIEDLEMEIIRTDPVFVWWHSFGHVLINQLAIDSGFMAVSLGERVYCTEKNNRYTAGLFIYASSPGTDGTLGGLTSLVDKDILPKIVEKALQSMMGCSNDPLCSSTNIHSKRRTGAACHVCLMNSETSCSYYNRYLDRNLVLESVQK